MAKSSGFRYGWSTKTIAIGVKRLEWLFVVLQLEHHKSQPYEQCEDIYQTIGAVMADIRSTMEVKKQHATRGKASRKARS